MGHWSHLWTAFGTDADPVRDRLSRLTEEGFFLTTGEVFTRFMHTGSISFGRSSVFFSNDDTQ